MKPSEQAIRDAKQVFCWYCGEGRPGATALCQCGQQLIAGLELPDGRIITDPDELDEADGVGEGG